MGDSVEEFNSTYTRRQQPVCAGSVYTVNPGRFAEFKRLVAGYGPAFHCGHTELTGPEPVAAT